jgi:hypothetical protein
MPSALTDSHDGDMRLARSGDAPQRFPFHKPAAGVNGRGQVRQGGLFPDGFERITWVSNRRGEPAVQALVDIIAGFVALIAAAALSLFGVDMSSAQKARPEIHRVRDCGGASSSPVMAASSQRSHDC